LLHRKGNVRARDRQVLKGTGHAAVVLGVVDRCTVGSKFVLAIDWSCGWLAGGHAGALEDVVNVPFLGQVEAVLGALDINAEEEAKCAHVFDGELGAELVDDVLKKGQRRPREDDVIHVEEEEGSGGAVTENEQGWVGASRREADGLDEGGEPLEPSPRRLAKAVEGFVQQADCIRTVGVDKSRGLLAEYLFFEMAVQKSIRYIELFCCPVA
jgi:hypothetical protein